MTFTVPTLQEALENARARMRAELPGTDAAVWPNTNYVYSKVWAGMQWELYQYLSWISRQKFATTADGDQLDAHGAQFNLSRNAAQSASGTVSLTGTASYSVPSGTLLERSDGVQFEIVSDTVFNASGSATATVRAVEVGTDGNTVGSASLTTVEDANITAATVGTDGLGGGAEIEDDESYRARILLRMRYPPHGGAAHDYVFWALSISGVTRVWVDSNPYGPGTVGVWFMTDNSTTDGIPSATSVSEVTAYIESQRPVTANVSVAAPTAATIDVTINGIGVPSLDTQALIENELKDVFRRAVQVSMPNSLFTLRANLLWQAIARATGDSTHTVRIPASDISITAGYVPVLGDVCYDDT